MQPLCNLAQEFAGNIGSASVMTLLSIPANALTETPQAGWECLQSQTAIEMSGLVSAGLLNDYGGLIRTRKPTTCLSLFWQLNMCTLRSGVFLYFASELFGTFKERL